MFDVGSSGFRRALVTFSVDDAVSILDLDDGPNLARRALRPSQVVHPSHTVSQEWAARIRDERVWDGISWWSFWFSGWSIVGIWTPSLLDVVEVEELHLDHPAVVDARKRLRRPLMPEADHL